MLNEFIERVEVHQGVGSRYHMTQQIDVYFNFIGQFQVPATENDADDKTAELVRKAI